VTKLGVCTVMKFNTLLRHFRESFKSIIRNGWMSFASTSSIAISLFILGVFLLLALNVNSLADQLESEVEIRVFLEINTQDEQVTSIQNQIGSIEEVERVTFVSKEEGLELMKEKFGEDGKQLLEGYEGDENPLNDSFTVKVDDPRNVGSVAAKIEKLDEGVNPPLLFKVVYGEGYVENLFAVTKMVRNVGLVLVAGLAFTAMFLISNTIKLTILARRREIAIMKLVGATNNFIRWPFFIEGALLGIIGSLIPIGILLYGYSKLISTFQIDMGMMMVQLLPLSDIANSIFGLLLGIGIVIGIWGSTISVRKFLKV
jgi:cell division transport system permease protein